MKLPEHMFYVKRGRALGLLDRVMRMLYVQPIEVRLASRVMTTLQICRDKVVNDIVQFANDEARKGR